MWKIIKWLYEHLWHQKFWPTFSNLLHRSTESFILQRIWCIPLQHTTISFTGSDNQLHIGIVFLFTNQCLDFQDTKSTTQRHLMPMWQRTSISFFAYCNQSIISRSNICFMSPSQKWTTTLGYTGRGLEGCYHITWGVRNKFSWLHTAYSHN